MKRAARILRAASLALVRDVWPEGVYLGLGSLMLAIGSSYLHPAGPWFIFGGTAVLIGLALAVPERKR